MTLARYASTAASIRCRAAYRAALCAIAETEGVPVTQLVKRRRASMISAGLHNRALYLAVTAFGVPARAIARVAGVTECQVRYALRHVEDERDDSSIDRMLDELELRMLP